MMKFVETARAPRKTIILGTISDHPGGMTNARYRKLAQQSLKIADRVLFVGPQAASVERLRVGDVASRLFAFQTCHEASRLLARDPVADELIVVKGSISDHLERVMLSQLDHVVCWRERCGRRIDCYKCESYARAHPPPFEPELEPTVEAWT
jgi:UDP-N-acetylmuramoyl-tripeptide--D-alanyl-D-alanine ligase